VANHVGDLGALAGDVGYLPTMSYCGRIRGDVLNMTAVLCGNRFGRGLVRPGGVGFDLDDEAVRQLTRRLKSAVKDTRVAVDLLWESPSVMARFDRTGSLSPELCNQIGMVGPAARASGVPRDVRRDFPFGIFRFAQIPVSTWDSGDVFGRAYVRWLEIQRSLAFIQEQLEALPPGQILSPVGPLAPNRFSVALTEGWRGEICHVLSTGPDGRFDWYKIFDPSFHNWFGLAMALRNQQISDFPLCNKSFNLSYCGHDL
jgi:Ni,Fe-hydrogenase III large subunit